ncbi:acylphosphatase [Halomonas sp. McH1-25]|uniref:acylphosphatase n=1 Tax=unclassified Halomonas TaxID=2609666 RepID=UPI001EF5BB79|nr:MULTISPECIES: acylphosphatase [unclassified Halomonas]MCG7598508.1 acylphosphatase [Halomonas sp. McH1-25]MCP1341760.1 acylphosphatase [Halomonas sp. FL8]MCP1360977.1 acylphosphatase [Halomonas sp. BBD45]MCP1363784.1 acylphosphatase [Halomonas sp. BBD48]
MSKCCVRALVSGKVQGVFYRRAAQERALGAGVTGYASNLPDGSVEVVLCGEGEAVDSVVKWLWNGPPDAKVTHVEVEGCEWRDYDTFATS